MTGCSPAQGSGSNELNSPRWQAALSNTDAQLTLVSPPCSLQVSSLDQIKEPSKKARGDGKKDDTITILSLTLGTFLDICGEKEFWQKETGLEVLWRGSG